MDLHAHSGYAGGVGNTSLAKAQAVAPLKGIDILATGDCLYPAWFEHLKNELDEDTSHPGTFVLTEDAPVRFVLQTEVILTAEIDFVRRGKAGTGRKQVHTVLLFPDLEAVAATIDLLERWDVKNTIGRPFIKCASPEEVAERCYALRAIDDTIEIVPAHLMTPQGVFGPNRPVDWMRDFYHDAVELIHMVETGLSADPIILGQIPELDDYALISNSDAHSPALHRMGREFTTVDVGRPSYEAIVHALRENRIVRTAEFNPTEGRYFLTGHRAGKKDHGDGYCVFSPKHTPENGRCPICGKKLTVGVLERALALGEAQGDARAFGFLPKGTPDFVHMVPLIEIIGHAKGIKTPTSKRVRADYERVVGAIGSECALWALSADAIATALEGVVDEAIIEAITTVKAGAFCFEPAGYDGTYGDLHIGEDRDFFDVREIHYDGAHQAMLSEEFE